ncbi:VanZ family protein [Chitinophaga barathri]|uniref:VanZ family protein n=1 Tax=Chitinophaga barathri TaxID=1647451 RepID=A0A3N4M915_9BACT|nr:VanZ family protein [Chitinophaga barathri]RPD40142.1 VanZ family protein [Chitinophaga barathri]
MNELNTNNKLSMRMIRYYLPAMGWIVLILFLCTLPGSAIPQISAFDKLHIDKVVHFLLFGVTVLLLAYGYYKQKGEISNWSLFSLVVMVTLYGLAIEFIQRYLVANRSFDMYDLLADGLGAVAGALVFSWIGKRFLK